MVVVIGCVALAALMAGGLWLASRYASGVIAESRTEALNLRDELERAYRDGMSEAEAESGVLELTGAGGVTVDIDVSPTSEANIRLQRAAMVNSFIAREMLAAGRPGAAEPGAGAGAAERGLSAALDHVARMLNEDQAHDPAVEAGIRIMLASRYLELGRFDRAAAQCELAEATLRFTYGEHHPYTLQALRNLGAVAVLRGRLEEADMHFRALAESRAALFGRDDGDALTLARFIADLSRFAATVRPDLPAADQPDDLRRFLDDAPECARFGPLEF
jgi:tetratricopeptide (TPR) repeat protein